jgi:hypothetical protein
MKTKYIALLPMLCIFLMSVTTLPTNISRFQKSPQELKMEGVYDGNEGYGYNFITTHKDDGSEFTMTFQKVDEAVIKEFDLNADLFLNKKFEVTYTLKTVVTKDENGFDDENEVYTITRLKAL